ncbi:MAG: siderophore-interacting protein [Actinomycetota bacterium]
MQVTGFAPDVTETIQELLPEVVVQYNDTIRLAARPQLGPIDTDVEISEISTDGVRIAANGESVWVDFASPVTGLDQLAQATVDLAEAARDLHPDEPMTSLEVIMTTARGQRLHRGEVIETRFLSDHLAAVRLGPFPGFESLGWDQSLSVLTMADGRVVPDDLTLETWRDMPEDESPRGRTYTVRSFDADGVMEIWMALHGDDPESTSTWAKQCQPGDAVAVFGPRGRFTEPTDVDHAVLVADETAFGAAAAVAEGLDPSISITIVGVIGGPDHEIDVGLDDRIAIRWMHAPVDVDARASAVTKHLEGIDTDRTYFWGAGEFEMTRSLRRSLRKDRGVPVERVAVSAYWRHGAH